MKIIISICSILIVIFVYFSLGVDAQEQVSDFIISVLSPIIIVVAALVVLALLFLFFKWVNTTFGLTALLYGILAFLFILPIIRLFN